MTGGPARDGAAVRPDSDRFRESLGRFATGVVVVAAADPTTGRPFGFSLGAFTSVALDPPLILLSVERDDPMWPYVRRCERWSVNVLARQHAESDLWRASPWTSGPLPDAGWTTTPDGTPVLESALAWLECSLEAEHRVGDHLIAVSRVHRLDTGVPGAPLVTFRGEYGTFSRAPAT